MANSVSKYGPVIQRKTSLKLEIQKAIRGKIIPSLREIILDWKSKAEQATLLFFHDGEITQSIKNHYKSIYDDVNKICPLNPTLKYGIYMYKYPKPLPKQSHVIYARREPFENPIDLDQYELDVEVISKEIFDKKIEVKKDEYELFDEVKLSIYRGLWGNVIPSLRRVTLQWNSAEKQFIVVFYHDGPITMSIYDLYSCIHVEVEADFVFNPKSDFKVIRSDYPKPLPIDLGFLIYLRREPFVDP